MSTTSQPNPPAGLEQMAQAKFGPLSGPLTTAEISLIRAAVSGVTGSRGLSTNNPLDNPADAIHWGKERTIRAELIRWMVVDRTARDLVDSRGIWAYAARITGQCNLSHVTAPFPIGLVQCGIDEYADFQFLDIPSLDLSGSYCLSLNLEHVSVKGDLTLEQLHCRGVVQLRGARIGGTLELSGASLMNAAELNSPWTGLALDASYARVDGSVLLRNGFSSQGAVRFFGAVLGDSLDCSNAALQSSLQPGSTSSGMALDATNLDVKGTVFFDRGFSANGLISLYGGKIGGNIDCDSGKLSNPVIKDVSESGTVLNAEGAKVDGAIKFCNGFEARGMIWMSGVEMGGSFDCSGGSFRNGFQQELPGTGTAIEGTNLKVGGTVLLRDGFLAEGSVSLYGVTVGGSLDCRSASLQNPARNDVDRGGIALDLSNANVTGTIFLGRDFSAVGTVRVSQAQIGGNLTCDGSVFRNPAQKDVARSGLALDASSVNVGGAVLLRDGFVAEGEVRIGNSRIQGVLGCDGGKFQNAPLEGKTDGGVALNVEETTVDGAMYLRQTDVAGQIRLFAAKIGGNLECDGANIKNPGKDNLAGSGLALDASSVNVGGAVYIRDGFVAEGEVRLWGAKIQGVLACDGGKFHNAPLKGVTDGGMALNAESATVDGALYFRQVEVEGKIRLFAAQIGGNLECDGTKIKNPRMDKVDGSGTALDVEGAKVAGNLYLHYQFEAQGEVRLYGTEIAGDLECLGGKFESLDLRNATCRSVLDDKASWPDYGKLQLDGFTYGRIAYGPESAEERLDWVARQSDFARQPYGQLASVLKQAGERHGWSLVCIEMERRAWAKKPWQRIVRPISWLLRGTYGYGYDSMRAMLWLVALVAAGCAVYQLGYGAGSLVPSEKEAYESLTANRGLPGYYPTFSALPYSLENSFPLVKLGVEDKWIPAEDGQHGPKSAGWLARSLSVIATPGFVRDFRWVQICLGWILATLFVAGVTGLVRND